MKNSGKTANEVIAEGISEYVQREILKDNIKAIHHKLVLEGKISRPQPRSIPWQRYTTYALAACMIGLLIWAGNAFWGSSTSGNMQKEQEIFIHASQKEHSTKLIYSMGDEVTLDDWETFYKDKNYTKVTEILEPCYIQTVDCEPILWTYLSYAHIQEGDYDKALQVLNKIPMDQFTFDESIVYWQKSLAYLGKKEIDNAKNELKKVDFDNPMPIIYIQYARELLEDLNEYSKKSE